MLTTLPLFLFLFRMKAKDLVRPGLITPSPHYLYDCLHSSMFTHPCSLFTGHCCSSSSLDSLLLGLCSALNALLPDPCMAHSLTPFRFSGHLSESFLGQSTITDISYLPSLLNFFSPEYLSLPGILSIYLFHLLPVSSFKI